MQTPLFHAISDHIARHRQSLHTPGHKNGRLIPPHLKTAWGDALFAYDLTELPGLDNLAAPTGALRDSQVEAATSLGSAFARYLINGSTLGLQAAALALCRGCDVFVPRHAHASVYHALLLADATPIPLDVELEPQSGCPLGVAPATLAKAIAAHPQCRHMVLVHPTYHGFVWQNNALMALARSHELTVIADEAHGAHFPYHTAMPANALALGAAIAVRSAHKTLPVPTQGSLLLGADAAFAQTIDQALRLLQTTSPSYVLLAGIEGGLAMMHAQGYALMEQGLARVSALHDAIDAMPHLRRTEIPQSDPFKCYLSAIGASPEVFATHLRQAGLEPEMVDHNGVLLMLPLDGPDQRLLEALHTAPHASPVQHRQHQAPPAAERVLSLKEAYFAPTRLCPLTDAEGAVSGQMLISYPPGIPLVLPGERISAALITAWAGLGQDPQIPVAVLLEKDSLCL